ncbi:MarR family transcriptional regulator [Microbacterium sp. zg-Y818]|uniref:MarR family winged helix-turn-helix transcriptional regulator n=1 Tax=unclassified Microbacterium TaxID=2609290 RepID=UPI00214C142C|nr:MULTISPECIES: MarR family transcriptional regulator [unclassified Microbacterium]MCR2802100.1 MarR family transcriptional regulator [Microbacterium sp. zg.Y818]WIM22647.1 MarR family transcriptional regulator [Microbacterium sp. zg-Y818]
MDGTTADPTPEAVLLTSLTQLMAQWASLTRQTVVAREAGLTIDAGDIRPIYTLGRVGPIRAGDLAADLRLTRPTMSKQLARLETAGLVTKSPDPDDGRASIVALSPEGERVFALLVQRGREMVDEAMRGWDAAERGRFAALTSRFVEAAIGTDADRPAAPTSDDPSA